MNPCCSCSNWWIARHSTPCRRRARIATRNPAAGRLGLGRRDHGPRLAELGLQRRRIGQRPGVHPDAHRPCPVLGRVFRLTCMSRAIRRSHRRPEYVAARSRGCGATAARPIERGRRVLLVQAPHQRQVLCACRHRRVVERRARHVQQRTLPARRSVPTSPGQPRRADQRSTKWCFFFSQCSSTLSSPIS